MLGLCVVIFSTFAECVEGCWPIQRNGADRAILRLVDTDELVVFSHLMRVARPRVHPGLPKSPQSSTNFGGQPQLRRNQRFGSLL